jgi:hypothetical protein
MYGSILQVPTKKGLAHPAVAVKRRFGSSRKRAVGNLATVVRVSLGQTRLKMHLLKKANINAVLTQELFHF